MDIKFEESIIKTLSYFDIFDYPLTLQELKKYTEQLMMLSDDELIDIILLIPIIQEANGYYYFLGRREIVEKRIERNDISVQKFAKARIIAKILSKIPTVDYIGVSGSLSMNNATLTDDIDLFFITQKNTLWLTRMLVNIVLIVLGQKRKRKAQTIKDKICPNMFLDRKRLSFSQKQRNLYIAHEIVQVKTVYDRNDSYNSFLSSNKWIQNFLPNVSVPSVRKKIRTSFIQRLVRKMTYPLEITMFAIQKIYMMPHKTIERVFGHVAMFHPVNKESIIVDMYRLKSDQYLKLYQDNLWLDKEEARFYFDEKKIRILN